MDPEAGQDGRSQDGSVEGELIWRTSSSGAALDQILGGVGIARYPLRHNDRACRAACPILAGPGSTGWLKDFPVVISKAAVSDFVVINIYGIGMVATVAVWAIWQKRGQQTEEVETSNYGRPLVKA